MEEAAQIRAADEIANSRGNSTKSKLVVNTANISSGQARDSASSFSHHPYLGCADGCEHAPGADCARGGTD